MVLSRGIVHHKRVLVLFSLTLLLAACADETAIDAPERVHDAPSTEGVSSQLSVPVAVPLAPLEAALQQRVPSRLWGIDRRFDNCVPPQRVEALGVRVRLTPDIGCRVVGQVTRGRMSLRGQGDRLIVTMPVNAAVSAKDVGGVLKSETADARADVRMEVRLSLGEDWRPDADVRIAYDWREEPGIEILGQRIGFVSRADKELAGVVRRVERELEAAIGQLDFKSQAQAVWAKGFTVQEVESDPPTYLRVTPRAVGLERIRASRREAVLDLSLEALSEIFVGEAPPAPEVTALPAPRAMGGGEGLAFAVPVLADYEELEPVILRELRELDEQGIAVPDVGEVRAAFLDVTVYGIEGGRVAVGIEAELKSEGSWWSRLFGTRKGRVWLTGRPINAPGSTQITIDKFDLYGRSDSAVLNRIGALLLSPAVKAKIEGALEEDFSGEYARVIGSVREALAELEQGDFRVSATIDTVSHGQVQATGAGLYLPVAASGTGTIRYMP